MELSRKMAEPLHREATHDIPLLRLLLAHHCNLIICVYDPAIQQRHPLANAARSATEAMEELENKLHEQASAEYPGADWLQKFNKESISRASPPKITGQVEVKA